MRNVSKRKFSKTSCKKSAKEVPGKKSAKRQVLSRTAGGLEYVFKTQRTPNSVVFLIRLGKGLFSQDF
jgi:hypothetical protein